jgi:phage shock protein PspC (stress-responsive transcriptional regulator)
VTERDRTYERRERNQDPGAQPEGPHGDRTCAGVTDYFGIDVSLVRVIVAVISVVTGGTGVLAYLVARAIIPGEGEKTSVAENIVSKKQNASAGR